MWKFVTRRVLLSLPTLLIVSFLAFGFIRLNPDSLALAVLGESATPEAIEEVKADYRLDKPIYTEYFRWLGKVVRGDLGTSRLSSRPVADELRPKLGQTFELAFLAIAFAVIIGVPIGVFAAMRQDHWPDYFLRSGAIGALSIPGFYIATMVLVLLANQFKWIPPLDHTSFFTNPLKNLEKFALPAFILSLATAAQVMRFSRTMMLDVLRQDYIRTAWAKGVRERSVIIRHALKNAMLPVITVLGLSMAGLVGGTVIFEQLFGIQGVGSYLIYSVFQKDFAPVQGVVLFFAVAVILINLIVDIGYTVLDPRTKV